MNKYEFSLCLKNDQDSTNNCKNGNLSSLPQESSIVLWNIIFDNKFDNQSDSSFNNTNVTQEHETKIFFTVTVLVFIVTSVAVFTICISRFRQRLRKLKKDTIITIPVNDLDTDGPSNATTDTYMYRTDDELTETDHKNKLEYEDESSSVDTFNEYDIPQRLKNCKNAQQIGVWQSKECFCGKKHYIENNLSICCSKKNTISEKKTVQNDKVICRKTLGYQNGHRDKSNKESKTSLDVDIKCEVVKHARCPTGESTPHVPKATDKNYADCYNNKSNEDNYNELPVAKSKDESRNDAASVDKTANEDDDNAVVPTNQNKLNSTDNEDYTRYNWTEIFIYLAHDIIDPKKYFLFFNILLGSVVSWIASEMFWSRPKEIRTRITLIQSIKLVLKNCNYTRTDAGFESPEKRISEIEENRKGNIVRTFIDLFHLWKDRVGTRINPKDIADTFEKLEWTAQLHAFKTYLRNPPLLRERSTLWKPLNEQDQRWPKLEKDQNNLPEFMYRGQEIVFPDDESFQVSEEEVVYEHRQNGENILKRRKRVVRKVSDRKRLKKDNRYFINSCINKSNNKNVRQSTIHKKRLKGAKNVNHRDKINNHCLIKQNISDEICFENSSDSFAMITDNSNSSYSNQSIGYCGKFLDGTGASSKSNTEEENILNADSGFGSSCFTSEMSHITSNQLSHEKKVKEYGANSLRQSQTPQGTNYTTKTMTGHEQYGLDQTASSQRGSSCQATSIHWNVMPNLKERPKMVNEKRHIENTRDGLEDRCFKKLKIDAELASIKSRRKRHKRGKNSLSWRQKFIDIVPRLAYLVERCFESKQPVNEKDFNIFIENLLSRLTKQPAKDDIVSLKLQSYMTAQAFTSNNGEVIHIISTEKIPLVLREREWTSLKTYVECARPDLMKKTHGYIKTDFLFLSYDGKPFDQELYQGHN